MIGGKHPRTLFRFNYVRKGRSSEVKLFLNFVFKFYLTWITETDVDPMGTNV